MGDPEALRAALSQMGSFPGHHFWADDVSLLDTTPFTRLPLSAHLTHVYLLGLAVNRQGSLATLERRIDPTLVARGTQAYFLIP